ncbi:hypothetical protein [Providencia huaxiensis]|uniref:hypothetical protein n=1 Tax=Providencia huaxiensis TaxID=2027290 RepID=UPI0034DCE4FD
MPDYLSTSGGCGILGVTTTGQEGNTMTDNARQNARSFIYAETYRALSGLLTEEQKKLLIKHLKSQVEEESSYLETTEDVQRHLIDELESKINILYSA